MVSEEISVLMPVAPRSTWLEQATSSLVAQTHQSWRLIAVLDGECEQNRAVLERPELDGRVRIKVLPGRSGVANALNAGLAEARTDLVARLDADDTCEPQRLAIQVEEFKTRPDLLVLGSGATMINERGRPIGSKRVPVGPRRVLRRLLWHNILVHPSVVFRREAIVGAGGYDPRCLRGQDYELWLRLATLGLLDNVAAPLIRYRVHPGQHSRPIVGPDDTRSIRAARRRAATASWTGSACADARHFAWLSYQHVQTWRRRGHDASPDRHRDGA
jgi:glycosyltransferase involved in cell wall biosynthesis